ncbi:MULTISPECIES: hypothetical protein [Pseudomonas syringae group]|uniref:Uncharacterized protein n=4 Tax=Pseudomonas syringae group TaxID=136849 RepID=A0AAD0DXY3_9PSED|nr:MULTISPECIES: hypothetical protein [Pseudomonas syringae group]AVB18208.1 hypothetical protein BKM03_02130 [Pseudomonas avellanae]EGH08765.1 hypothetical protein PSYMP_07675 [Pseudomonas amygdali pv. morsprunorum str. M302280]KWS70338.1 hypothetical protein AL055_15390 [Pseudomonas amygdali pv. morsprunorum]PHN40374.1 hypothetical protein AO261_15310 [Pseudomonas avellanae]POC96941.1 hypothetical protein BKM26_04880 [Pseudomonas avellanae]
MKYYKITQDDRYKTLIDGDSAKSLQQFATQLAYGKAELIGNEAFKVKFNEDDNKKKPLSDIYTFFRPILIASERAAEALQCTKKQQAIKLELPQEGLVGFFVTQLLENHLNKEKSKYDQGPNGYVVYKMVLQNASIIKHDMFRILESPQTIIASEQVKERILERKLKGFTLIEIPCTE